MLVENFTPTKRIPIGSAIKCSPTQNNVAGGIYRYDGNNAYRLYPNPDVANTYDPNWTNYKTLNCKGMTYNGVVPVKPIPVGSSIKCSPTQNNVEGGVYRYDGNNVYRLYPNPDVANSYDPNWINYKTVDCKGMTYNGVVPVKPSVPYLAKDFVQFTGPSTDISFMTDSLENCQKACDNNSACLGFSRGKDAPMSTGDCWLKKAYPQASFGDGTYQTFVKPGTLYPMK